MWIMTPDRGFFSVVQDRNDQHHLWVRARAREDLERLLKMPVGSIGDPSTPLNVFSSDIIELDASDYRYRIRIDRGYWEKAMTQMTREVNYDNFKSAVEARQGKDRADIYMSIWMVLLRLQPFRLGEGPLFDDDQYADWEDDQSEKGRLWP